MADSGYRHIPPDPQPDTMPVEAWERQMGYVMERLDSIEAKALKPDDIARALQQAIMAAAQSPETWSAALTGAKAATSNHAGRVVLGALGALASRALLVLVIGMLVYSVGGWTALAKVWNAVTGSEAQQ